VDETEPEERLRGRVREREREGRGIGGRTCFLSLGKKRRRGGDEGLGLDSGGSLGLGTVEGHVSGAGTRELIVMVGLFVLKLGFEGV
jgi:hypothetical protein